jgi:GNAT superfamily N-acetyltransferase
MEPIVDSFHKRLPETQEPLEGQLSQVPLSPRAKQVGRPAQFGVNSSPVGGPRFRPAEPGDIQAVHELVKAAYRQGDQAGWTTEAHLVEGERISIATLERILEDPAKRLLVAFLGEELVGCCLLEPEVKAGVGVVAHFGLFAVSPRLQSRGIGTALLAQAESVAREQLHASAIELRVLEPRSELIGYYERRGYLLDGRREPFKPDPHDRPKVEGLCFVVMHKSL